MGTDERIFKNLEDLLNEHDCFTWDEFRVFVSHSTNGVADVGYIGGNEFVENFKDEDVDEKNGIYFLTEDSVGKILYFPISFDEINQEIENLKIF